MHNKLSIERIKQYATDPRMCNISDELRSGMVELLAYREAESKPVAFTDSDELAFKYGNGGELWEKPFDFGRDIPLYASPVLSQPVPDELVTIEDVNNHVAGNHSKLIGYKQGWNACRDAVLSASPVLGQTPD